jgi:membrane protein implicated in regulation of membrane protease activity
VVQTWVIWLIIAVVLGVAEVMTTTLALGLIGASALVAAGVAAVGGGPLLQLGAFILASAGGVGIVRPIAMRHIKHPPLLRTGTAALVGRTALVLDEVSDHGGRVRIGGEDWSARPYDEDMVIPAGTKVDVFKIEGVTALVYPRQELA